MLKKISSQEISNYRICFSITRNILFSIEINRVMVMSVGKNKSRSLANADWIHIQPVLKYKYVYCFILPFKTIIFCPPKHVMIRAKINVLMHLFKKFCLCYNRLYKQSVQILKVYFLLVIMDS